MNMAAIYPGTFDPITLGHVDLIRRAARLFDRLILAVSDSLRKSPLFTQAERLAMARELAVEIPQVEVDSFDGLLVEYARRKQARVILRGLRAFSDFEYEFQMALMNRKLLSTVETVYLMPSEEYVYLNSTIVKEVALLGGNIRCFVPEVVASALFKKIQRLPGKT